MRKAEIATFSKKKITKYSWITKNIHFRPNIPKKKILTSKIISNVGARGHQKSNIRVRMFGNVRYFLNIEMFDVRMFANIQMFESSNVRMFANIWMFKCSMFECSLKFDCSKVRMFACSLVFEYSNVRCSNVR